MTRRISSYISVLLTAALALASCDKEPAIAPADSQTLTICLSPADMELTRAESDEYGSDTYNENVLHNFKLYFYTENSEDAVAQYIYPASGLAGITSNAGATGYATSGLTVDPESGKVTLKLALDKDKGDALFPSGTASNCYVYAVVNTGSLVDLPSTVGADDTKISEIKKLPVLAEFGPTKTSSPYADAQEDFVMDGSAKLSMDADQNISGTVELSRAAAKITFYVTEVKNVTDYDTDGKTVLGTWTAQTDRMEVCYRNTVNYGIINGETTAAERNGNIKSYSTSQCRPLEAFTTSAGATAWTHSLPFYSYYDNWESSDDSDAPYLLVKIPWKYQSETAGSTPRYFTCYYAVPFNSITRVIDRNTWYKVSLSVSILGSGDPDNPTEITPSYMVLPWGSNPVQTNADLKRYRYLLVDQNEYVMNNVDSLEIPFYSSHNVTKVSAKMTKTVLKPSSGYKPYEEEVTLADDALYFDNSSLPGKSKVTFRHDLINDYSETGYDVTAYTLTFTFQHDSGSDEEDENFVESVTVVQYPALYVVAELNSDCTGNPDNGTTSNLSNRGYVWVNNAQGTSSWQSVLSSGSSPGNKDPYMYVVTVSSLPKGTSYIIGDPRAEESTDLSEYNTSRRGKTTYWASEAADMYGNNRRLAYYYPSDQTSRAENMIAPSFRIASSYGVAGSMSFDNAKKRCASYQEDGYPAGRWRIPTKAEIEYMAMLAGDGKIPVLLSTKTSKRSGGWEYTYYWGADGYNYSPDGTNPGEDNSAFIRCVYDEWYWKGDTCTKTTFTWGDKAR